MKKERGMCCSMLKETHLTIAYQNVRHCLNISIMTHHFYLNALDFFGREEAITTNPSLGLSALKNSE